MSEDYYEKLSKWWEDQWEKYHHSVYAIVVCAFLTLIYYVISYTEPVSKTGEITREFFLGIIIHTVPILIIVVISFVLYRRMSEKKAERQKKEFISEIEHIIIQSLTSESELRKMLQESGFQGVYERHHRDMILNEIGTSSKEVGILHTYLVKPNSFEQPFVRASRNGAKIRVLLLDPESAVARQRSIDMWPGDNPSGADKRYVPSQIRLTVNEFKRIIRTNNLANVEIRLYDSLLSVQIYRCDDDLYLGFYPKGKKSLEAAQLKIHGYTYFSSQFLGEFDFVWNKAAPVDLGLTTSSSAKAASNLEAATGAPSSPSHRS